LFKFRFCFRKKHYFSIYEKGNLIFFGGLFKNIILALRLNIFKTRFSLLRIFKKKFKLKQMAKNYFKFKKLRLFRSVFLALDRRQFIYRWLKLKKAKLIVIKVHDFINSWKAKNGNVNVHQNFLYLLLSRINFRYNINIGKMKPKHGATLNHSVGYFWFTSFAKKLITIFFQEA
jgi:hypothetical protein